MSEDIIYSFFSSGLKSSFSGSKLKLISVLFPLTKLSAHPATEIVVYNRNRIIPDTTKPMETNNSAGVVQITARIPPTTIKEAEAIVTSCFWVTV